MSCYVSDVGGLLQREKGSRSLKTGQVHIIENTGADTGVKDEQIYASTVMAMGP